MFFFVPVSGYNLLMSSEFKMKGVTTVLKRRHDYPLINFPV